MELVGLHAHCFVPTISANVDCLDDIGVDIDVNHRSTKLGCRVHHMTSATCAREYSVRMRLNVQKNIVMCAQARHSDGAHVLIKSSVPRETELPSPKYMPSSVSI